MPMITNRSLNARSERESCVNKEQPQSCYVGIVEYTSGSKRNPNAWNNFSTPNIESCGTGLFKRQVVCQVFWVLAEYDKGRSVITIKRIKSSRSWLEFDFCWLDLVFLRSGFFQPLWLQLHLPDPNQQLFPVRAMLFELLRVFGSWVTKFSPKLWILY